MLGSHWQCLHFDCHSLTLTHAEQKSTTSAQNTELHAFALQFWTYLVNLVQNIYAGNVDPAALYAVHKVVNVTVFLEMNVCVVDLVL